MKKIKTTFLTLILTTLSFSSLIADTQQYPTVNLEITFRQKENNKISQGLHIMHLDCEGNNCELIYLTLNQCMGPKSNVSFYPKIETYSTNAKNLTVNIIDQLILVEQIVDLNGYGKAHFKIGYKKPDLTSLGISEITSFEGYFEKFSTILNEKIKIDYIPLKGHVHDITFDCPAEVNGLPGKYERDINAAGCSLIIK